MNPAKLLLIFICVAAALGATVAGKANRALYFIYSSGGYTTVPVDFACTGTGTHCTTRVNNSIYTLLQIRDRTYIPVQRFLF